MVKLLVPSLVMLPLAAAFPSVMEFDRAEKEAQNEAQNEARTDEATRAYQAHKLPNGMYDNPNYVMPKYRAPTHLIQRPNTGQKNRIFNAERQLTPTTGKHKFIAPGPKDKRGQCAGLNAAANHGYLPRDGMPNFFDTVKGLTTAYEMGADVAAFLGILSVALEGDPITTYWSIGGGMKTGIDGFSGGLYGTHNSYENDGSIMMGDAYLNGGEVGIFQQHSYTQWSKFRKMFNTNNEYTFRQAAAQTDWVHRFGIENNPYYFKGPFSGVVSPAAHNLVIDLFSNHSAERPEGFLTQEVFNSFFAVTGEEGKEIYHVGHERIPDNWYRRPFIHQNSLADIGIDLVQNNAAYPGILSFGGNTGKKNSFVGVSIGQFTKGQYGSIEDLAKGNNFACFILQASLAGIPAVSNPVLGTAGTLLSFVVDKFEPLRKKFDCPELTAFDNSFFDKFPGYHYHPKGGK